MVYKSNGNYNQRHRDEDGSYNNSGYENRRNGDSRNFRGGDRYQDNRQSDKRFRDFREESKRRNNDEHRELFTATVDTKIRRYFFDVKKATNGSKYLVISETRRQDGRLERDRIFVFQEDLDSFKEAYLQAMNALEGVDDKNQENINTDESE